MRRTLTLVRVSSSINIKKMPSSIIIKNKISNFNKTITVSGDKSISIRWVLFSSIANGISRSQNLLRSEDVLAAITAVLKGHKWL